MIFEIINDISTFMIILGLALVSYTQITAIIKTNNDEEAGSFDLRTIII